MSSTTAEYLKKKAEELGTEIWIIESPFNRYQPPPPPGHFAMRSHKRRGFFKLTAENQLPSMEELTKCIKAEEFFTAEYFASRSWSKEVPTQEGHYWWRDVNNTTITPSIVYIYKLVTSRHHNAAFKAGTWIWEGSGGSEGRVVQTGSNEWSGPLMPPP